MNNETAQLVAFACHFNGRARGLCTGASRAANSTCQGCEYVHFSPKLRRFGADNFAATELMPDDWIDAETRPGRSALIGGGRGPLNLVAGKRMNVWEPRWEIGNRDASDQRIWRVTYSEIVRSASIHLPSSPINSLSQELRQVLLDFHTFSEQHRVHAFSICFQEALDCLSSDDPSAFVRYKDLAPTDFSVYSRDQCQTLILFHQRFQPA